jgi:hypothetical protein
LGFDGLPAIAGSAKASIAASRTVFFHMTSYLRVPVLLSASRHAHAIK